MRESLSIIVNNIKLPINASLEEAFSVAENKLRSADVLLSKPKFSVSKKSVDARDKSKILFVYSVCVSGVKSKPSEATMKKYGFTLYASQDLKVVFGTEHIKKAPVIVGSGPCGMFCALLLAEHGYNPTLIERGGSVEERKKAVERLNKFGILDKDTNIQFGAGGAGTFSDGKLITRINDPLSNYVLEKLVEFGAPSEILTASRPHVGTDILSSVVNRILSRIEALGGSVLYHTSMLSASTDSAGNIKSIRTNKSVIECDVLVLAVGHSAREMYRYLIENDYLLEAKPFSVGMRIEHLTKDIDTAMYGDMAENPLLPHAEYNLSTNTKSRGVYTFCMCPGGEVVAATSEEFGTVTNGMSHNKRDGRNSNSAVVCSVFKEDYGNTPFDAIDFQQKIEHMAYKAGGEGYSAPIITVRDFLGDTMNFEPKRIRPTYRNGENVKIAPPSSYLPPFICEAIKGAIVDFDKKIKGFAADDAVLTGAETRTSAPIRIIRSSDSRTVPGHGNLYPAGEGAGYAGGITSAAIDGIKTALAIMARYKPN